MFRPTKRSTGQLIEVRQTVRINPQATVNRPAKEQHRQYAHYAPPGRRSERRSPNLARRWSTAVRLFGAVGDPRRAVWLGGGLLPLCFREKGEGCGSRYAADPDECKRKHRHHVSQMMIEPRLRTDKD